MLPCTYGSISNLAPRSKALKTTCVAQALFLSRRSFPCWLCRFVLGVFDVGVVWVVCTPHYWYLFLACGRCCAVLSSLRSRTKLERGGGGWQYVATACCSFSHTVLVPLIRQLICYTLSPYCCDAYRHPPYHPPTCWSTRRDPSFKGLANCSLPMPSRLAPETKAAPISWITKVRRCTAAQQRDVLVCETIMLCL